MPDKSGLVSSRKNRMVCICLIQTKQRRKVYCTINTQKRDANKAQSLEGYLWAVTTLKKEKMQIKCLTDTHVIDVKPPLTVIHVSNGCEAYCKAQPGHALLGYPFHNTAAHMEAMPTREGI